MPADRRGPFEPEVAAVLASFERSGRLPYEQLTVEEARATYRAGRDTVQFAKVEVAEVRDIELRALSPLAARLYRPVTMMPTGAAPAILFFHGGGGVIGDLGTHDSICRRLANVTVRTVIAIDYRLAPEHRFPAAVDDAAAAFMASVAGAGELRIDPANIAVAGDSAGGSLAAVAAICAAKCGLPRPAAALLFYPVTDLRGGTWSNAELSGVPLTGCTMEWFRSLYLGEPADATDWRASPLIAASLAGFPPTFLTSAGHDPLCDEAFGFAERLRDAGVRVVHRHLPGQIHGYLTLGRMIGEATRSIDAAARFLADDTLGRKQSWSP